MTIGISLGWNCAPAVHGVHHKIRATKSEGYKTCPFDEMISNYEGVVQCLNDDFQDFFDLCLLQISNESQYCTGDLLIYNPKYKFLFNHESPGHANLWQIQQWPGGINQFVDNKYLCFKERYQKRIENFRNYLQSGEDIHFLISSPNEDDTFDKLRQVLDKKYKGLQYTIQNIGLDQTKEHYEAHMKLLGIS